MASRAICRVLELAGYHQLFTASRSELDLLDGPAMEAWSAEHQPTMFVAAATDYLDDFQWDSSKPDGTLKKQLDVSRLAGQHTLAERLGPHGASVLSGPDEGEAAKAALVIAEPNVIPGVI